MRRTLVLFVSILLLGAACAKHESKPKPLSVPGEKVYTLDGRILSRDAGDNTLRIDHKDIPGYMEAMTMDYTVRGAGVQSLPPDQSHIVAKLHVAGDAYWITDVRKAGP
jgi:copper binding protein CusF